MTFPLLTTKLYLPPPRADRVPRGRLLARLEEGLRLDRRLTLISAPAGYGKTTLLSEWLYSRAAEVAWLSLDESDNDPMRFWAYLLAALRLRPADAEVTPQQLWSSPQLPPPQTLATLLLNELAARPERQLLVLDDYQTLNTPAIHEAVAYFVEHLPPSFHLVIATRADPPLPLARLRARGQLTELRAADLRFTSAEAATLLNEIMGLGLTPADLNALEARTEGWIAGLQLAALSLRDHHDRAGFIAAFTGSHRFILDYLMEEVLRRQPPALQEFLLRTSILERLSGPLCDALGDASDPQAELSQPAAVILPLLEQSNLFVVPLDDHREWYRYHHLFAHFLQERLRQLHPEQIAALHRRAAAWYEQQGAPVQAVDHALQAADWEGAARLITPLAESLLLRGAITTLLGWLEALPASVIQAHPWLALYYASALTLAGQMQRVEPYLQLAEQRLSGDSLPAEPRGMIQAIRAYQAMLLGQIETALTLAQQAAAATPPDRPSLLRDITHWLLSFAAFFTGEITAVDAQLEQVINQLPTDSLLTLLLTIYMHSYLHQLHGGLRAAQSSLEQGLWLTQAHEDTSSPVVSVIYQGLANLARERNELAAAESWLQRCLALAEAWGNAEVLVDSYIVLARLRLAQHNRPTARLALEQAAALEHQGQLSPLTVQYIRLWQMQVALPEELAAVERWAANLQAWPDAAGPQGLAYVYPRVLEQAVVGRLRLAQGRYTDALALWAALIPQVEAVEWWGVVIELLALQAITWQAAGHPDRALDTLQRALALAEPEGFVRTFVDLGAPLQALLERYLAAAPGREPPVSRTYVMRLLAAFEDQPAEVNAPAGPPATDRAPLPEPLSERELEVLRLVAAGLSNQEIAARLFVAPSTVKTHLNNLYRKLNASGRLPAVTRARDLGLL